VSQPRYGGPAAAGRKWDDAAIAGGVVAAGGGLAYMAGVERGRNPDRTKLTRLEEAGRDGVAHRDALLEREKAARAAGASSRTVAGHMASVSHVNNRLNAQARMIQQEEKNLLKVGRGLRRGGAGVAAAGTLAALGSVAASHKARARAARPQAVDVPVERDYRRMESAGGLLRTPEGYKAEVPSGRDWINAHGKAS